MYAYMEPLFVSSTSNHVVLSKADLLLIFCLCIFRFDHNDTEFVQFLQNLTSLFSNGDFINFAVYLDPACMVVATLLQVSSVPVPQLT